MGMSASQIRYCMLQARKNDIEYQGQQINQQRTTLATQSAAHNTELLTLTVPTPPSTEQYTTVNYTYSMNGNDCTIKGLSYKGDGTYKVNYTTKEIKDVATLGSTFSYKEILSTADDGTEITTKKVILNGKEYNLTNISEDSENDDIHSVNRQIIANDFKLGAKNENGDYMDEGETYYFIELNNGTNAFAYFRNTDLTEANNLANKWVKDYVVSAQKVDKDDEMIATVNWAETGRMASITEIREDGTTGRTFNLQMDTIADNEAYENAYNEYLYKKDQYNKTMDEINARLEIIQAQDKELELQLRNLDTQQQAISTEMDAVKSVTDKNIEKSFNVFG